MSGWRTGCWPARGALRGAGAKPPTGAGAGLLLADSSVAVTVFASVDALSNKIPMLFELEALAPAVARIAPSFQRGLRPRRGRLAPGPRLDRGQRGDAGPLFSSSR